MKMSTVRLGSEVFLVENVTGFCSIFCSQDITISITVKISPAKKSAAEAGLHDTNKDAKILDREDYNYTQ